ncbi:MAG: aspartate carbamoyltransferase regulatory subunit, partial [Thermofilum sp.]|nr:aspartate carbamoyltransferase regulatory subunit [Thermofilum sp.]
ILGLSGKEGSTIAIVINVPSKKLGRKDIVKVEGKFLEPKEVDKIALIAPTATINIVKDFRVLEKRRVQIPREVKGLLRCSNPNCITNTKREPIETRFKLVSITPLKLKCCYCEDIVTEEQVIQQLVRE